MRVGEVLAGIARRPIQTLILGWNWKAAVLSALYRAVIFFATAARGGWRSAFTALTIEAAFRIVVTGLYGALAQQLRNARPIWLAALNLLLAPAAIQALEYWIHAAAGTPGRILASVISTAAAGISALFSWFAMRRGAFLTGPEGQGLLADLRQYPRLLVDFLIAGPKWLVRSLQRKAAHSGSDVDP